MKPTNEMELDRIEISKTNPRSQFDQLEIEELAASIKIHGVLQPILVRPVNGTVQLVCGERRLRASKLAGLKKIPYNMRELTDDQALEAQIIENLQRKDVHPMDEAVAFKQFADQGKDVKEIAARVGKSEFYARQRMRLLTLSLQWQAAFYANRIPITSALAIAAFDEDIQKDLWQQEVRNESGEIKLREWSFDRYKGQLAKADFNTQDPTLDKKMGACSSCSFNTAVASLFPEDAENPLCTKVSCFANKAQLHFTRELDAAKQEPGMLFAFTDWGSHSDEVTKSLEKEGFPYYSNNSHFEELYKPDAPNDDQYDIEDYESEADMLKAIADEKLDYKIELDEYNAVIASGKFKRAFVVHGSRKGTYTYIKPLRSAVSASKQMQNKESAGTLATEDITAEIKRIQDREKRAKEIDLNRTHVAMLNKLASVKELKSPGLKFDQACDRAIMIYMLLEYASYSAKNKIYKVIKSLNGNTPYGQVGYREDYFKALGKVNDDQLAFILRTIALDKWGNGGSFAGNVTTQDTVLYLVASYSGLDLKAIGADQDAIAAKRQERVDKRIAQLQAQKKQLTKDKKPKPAKKKESAIGKGLRALINETR